MTVLSPKSPRARPKLRKTSSGWIPRLPDDAVSVRREGSFLVLRASRKLQERFEELLDGRKVGTLSPKENQEYEAICRLDDTLSWLNRLARDVEIK
jgi:hypothetical protein